MSLASVLEQFAWLYTRGDESVYMRVEGQGDGFRVIVNGPGWAHSTYDFDGIEPLRTFISDYQQQLVANAFQLQAKAERRSGNDRRGERSRLEDRRKH